MKHDKRKQEKKQNSKVTLAVIFMVIGLLLFICLGKAVYLVIKNGSEYSHKALSQATGSSRVILARPGNIIDANGMNLTSTRKVFRLILDPKVMNETETSYKGSLQKTVELLSQSFNLSAAELTEAFTSNVTSQYVRVSFCPILEEDTVNQYKAAVEAFNTLKKETNAKLEKNSPDRITARVAGVWFEEEYRRSYPFDDLMSKVIGYTTEDTSQGILGLELQYQEYLQGTNGREYKYVDEQGNVKPVVTEAKNGYQIYTSLDTNVARIVREEIKNYQANMEGGNRINVLVMNPQNGEVITMESDTEFDLNHPTDLTQLFTPEELEKPEETFLLQEAFLTNPTRLAGMSYEERLTALLQQVQMNYQVSATFEPGSTAKTLTVAAGIDSGLVSKNDKWYCDGEIQVANYNIHCHMETLCGYLNPMESLGRSCNVCLVQIAEQMGKSVFTSFQERFNLGQRTNIDLPGEANTKNLLYTEQNMQDVNLATCSFGQGFNVTMIQMAAAYASVVNGGVYYQPHIVTKITDESGNAIKEIEPVLVRHTISEETCEYLKESLRYVVVKGTASEYLYHEGYDLGGKTGAAEKLPRGTGKYICSFIGCAPVQKPEFLLYVVVDEPHVEDQSMSLPAQKLASNIFKRLYAYYGIFNESGDDAYQYDWSSMKDSGNASDSHGGESDIDDPNNTIDWIIDEENAHYN